MMKSNWAVKNKCANKKKFKELEAITECLMLQRGIDSEEKKRVFLHPDYDKDVYDPYQLTDMDKAVNCVLRAKESGKKVCIYGDYDVDGITSTVILYDFFKEIGINCLGYLPDRNKEGYGLNEKAIDYLKKQGVEVIVTVDCGITNFAEVVYAHKKGMEVVVTDHHFVPKELPPAVAVINPKKEGDPYPEKMLAGVGVTFKFIQAIARQIEGYNSEQLKWLLDLVAIGNVADCVPLIGENRTLTKFGLMVLAKTRRVGLKQLFHVGRIKMGNGELPTGDQIGFQIAPRINAAGRIDHASIAYELLIKTQKEIPEARLLALEMESKNRERQKLTEEIIKEIQAKIDNDNLPKVIIESSPHWLPGIVGLVAGRLADQLNRPVIILHDQGEILKGSCRSGSEFHLMKALEKLSGLLEHYGGHAQAAGLTIKKKNLPRFEKEIISLVEESGVLLADKNIEIDLPIKIADITDKLVDELNMMEPFGQGNKKPKFLLENVVIDRVVYMGNNRQHLKFFVKDEEGKNNELEFVSFNFKNQIESLSEQSLEEGMVVNLVIVIEENNWNGSRRIQGRVIDIEIC